MSTDPRSKSRRSFLQSAAGVGALASVAAGSPAQTDAPPLPKVRFGKTEITRLIIGSNPFYGYSHFNRILDQCMREWYSQDRRMEVLHACEAQGITTWQVHYNDAPMDDFRRYRAEGGKMHLILLADFELMKNPKLLPEVAKLGPLGIGHHGNRTDERFRNGEKQKVKDFLKAVRDTGVMVGVSTHNPAVVDTVESEGWDVDYYQTCLYRVSRTAEEARAEFNEAPIGETYMEKDPERMCKMIRQTKKPCLAFKLFGAGRTINTPEIVERAFRFAFANIKPTDAVIVGMFPRFRDEVRENTALVRKILA
ncbi:MAG TPA: aldo/keto reductase [Bryobacteraceae bacterium]|nr:aldo/keto reductase [Bryobacteraceae bacterium]